MKRILRHRADRCQKVAPHAGAWIETDNKFPVRIEIVVAPHAGAWIETSSRTRRSSANFVAPHAGAWIETLQAALSAC